MHIEIPTIKCSNKHLKLKKIEDVRAPNIQKYYDIADSFRSARTKLRDGLEENKILNLTKPTKKEEVLSSVKASLFSAFNNQKKQIDL